MIQLEKVKSAERRVAKVKQQTELKKQKAIADTNKLMKALADKQLEIDLGNTDNIAAKIDMLQGMLKRANNRADNAKSNGDIDKEIRLRKEALDIEDRIHDLKQLDKNNQAERQAAELQKRMQEAELARETELSQLKAKYIADGKLDKQENISLAQKEVELQKQRVAEAKKLAEEAKAANKAQAKNALAQAQIELGERMRDLKALTDEPLKAKRNITQTGGFLATRVSLIGSDNPVKETAKNTKEMVKHTKNTEKYTKKIAESKLTFD